MKKTLKILLVILTMMTAITAGAKTAQAVSLSTPKMKSVKNQTASVKITWKTVSKAKGYYVYRKQGNGSYKQIAKVSGGSKSSYTDKTVKSGKKYTYRVKAYNGGTKSSVQKKGLSTRFLAKPTLTAESTGNGSIKLSWKSASGATGYKIYRKTNGSYKKIKTVTGKTSYTDSSVSTGTSYTYKIIAYKGNYQSVKSTATCKASAPKITTLSAKKNVAISADVKLSGSGTGYHAKLVIGNADAAVSFGLQYDQYAVSPYTGKTAFLVENILSGTNQQYTRFTYNGSKYASLNKTYNLTISLTKSTGEVRVYVNNKKIGSVTNKNLANSDVYIWVEGAARVRNDSVNATFKNIQVIENNALNTKPQVSFVQAADGLSINTSANAFPSTIKVNGTLTSLGTSYDWDSAPSSVNGYVRFY